MSLPQLLKDEGRGTDLPPDERALHPDELTELPRPSPLRQPLPQSSRSTMDLLALFAPPRFLPLLGDVLGDHETVLVDLEVGARDELGLRGSERRERGRHGW